MKNEPSPKKYRGREATMQKLIETGFEVFSEVGFNGATTRLISQRSGVNESLIIRYFKSKSGLFIAILMDFFQRHCAIEAHYTPGQNVEQEIENYLQFHVDQALIHKDFMRMIVSQLAIDTEARKQVQQLIQTTMEGAPCPLETRLRAFQEKGKIRKEVQLKQLLNVLETYVDGIRFNITMASEFKTKDEVSNEIRFFSQQLGFSLGK